MNIVYRVRDLEDLDDLDDLDDLYDLDDLDDLYNLHDLNDFYDLYDLYDLYDKYALLIIYALHVSYICIHICNTVMLDNRTRRRHSYSTEVSHVRGANKSECIKCDLFLFDKT